MNKQISLFWFRRDLRVEDNIGLYHALNSDYPVLPLFIFDPTILDGFEPTNPRVSFLLEQLDHLQKRFHAHKRELLSRIGTPHEVFAHLTTEYEIKEVHWNRDYDPRARARDEDIQDFLTNQGIKVTTHKDQVIFEEDEILTGGGTPYTVFTPYSKKWLEHYHNDRPVSQESESILSNCLPCDTHQLPTVQDLGFRGTDFPFPPRSVSLETIRSYHKTRDIPSLEHGTTHLGPHLRFGTLSIRKLASLAEKENSTYLNELIWREFYQQILYHFPHVIDGAFKEKYNAIPWRNDETEFQQWCEGRTGFPIVDAGMRELTATGYMHNRLRMITASFLTKDLLVDWRWGEQFFAKHLLDHEVAANNGGWQWAAGTGCDAAPYFRIFNPTSQQEKFDPNFEYIKKWVPEYETLDYPQPMVDHKAARLRCLEVYKRALNTKV